MAESGSNENMVVTSDNRQRRLPLIRQHTCPCDFQKNHSPPIRQSSKVNVVHEPVKKKASLTDKLPEIMAKFKAQLSSKSFIVKTRHSTTVHKREERPWVKGNEISPFFHVWQTSDDHLRDQTIRVGPLRKTRSMPRNFKFSDVSSDKALVPNISTNFGIVRQCCSRPRLRVKLFPET